MFGASFFGYAWSRVVVLVCAFLFVGCGPVRCGTRVDVAAEQQLQNYIDLIVNITRMDQREELESLTTGEFRDGLTSASPEAFKKAYLDQRYEFESFEVVGKTETTPGRELELEYRVKFRRWMTGEDKTRSPFQELRNVATMKYTNGHWAIAKIRSIDTEYSWEIGVPMDGVSTQGVTTDSPVVDPFAEESPSNDGQMPEGQPQQPQQPAAQPTQNPLSP